MFARFYISALLVAASGNGAIHNLRATHRELHKDETEWVGIVNADDTTCPPNYCVTNLKSLIDGPESPEVVMSPCGLVVKEVGINAKSQLWEFRDIKPKTDFSGLLTDGLPVFQIASKRGSSNQCIAVDDCSTERLVMVGCDGPKKHLTYWMGFTGGVGIGFLPIGPSGGEVNLGCWADEGMYVSFHVQCKETGVSSGFLQVPEVVMNSVRRWNGSSM